MKIDKINDEFIIDCTNSTLEEKGKVIQFLVNIRLYNKSYLFINLSNYKFIVCKKKDGNCLFYNLNQVKSLYPTLNIYTFNQFKNMYLNNKVISGYKLINLEKKELVEILLSTVNDKISKNNIIHDLNSIELINKFGFLDIYFKPIFIDNFELNDILVFEPTDNIPYSAKKGFLCIVDKIRNDNLIDVKWITKTTQVNGGYYIKDFRKLTDEEINIFDKLTFKIITIGNPHNEVRLYYDNFNINILVAGTKILYDDLLNLYNGNYFSDTTWKIQINNCNIGCWENIKREEIKIIIDSYKEMFKSIENITF